MHETARWANVHHGDTAKILSPLSGLPLAIFAHMERSAFTDQLTHALLQPSVDVAYRYGVLKAEFDTSEIVSAAARYSK